MSDLKDFAAASLAAADISHSTAAAALERLTSRDSKIETARKLLRDAQSLFVIDDETETRLAEMLADPSARRRAEWELHGLEYRRPGTTWVGTGYSLVMDAVFAEDEPLAECHVVAVPVQWSCTLWHGERDLTEDGYQYSNWPYAELPSMEVGNEYEPIKLVMISENLCGTLTWGDANVSLYHGEISVRENHTGARILSALDKHARVEA